MPSNEDKSGSDNYSLSDSLEIFETLFRTELDALEAGRKENARLKPDAKENKVVKKKPVSRAKPQTDAKAGQIIKKKPVSHVKHVKDDAVKELRPETDAKLWKIKRRKIGLRETTGEGSHRLRIGLSAFLLVALGAFSINYFGIVDLSRFMPFSEPTQKPVVQPRVVKKSPVEVDKKPTGLASKSPKKAGTPLPPDKATSQKVGPATKKRPMSTISKKSPPVVKKHPEPETSVKKPTRAGQPSSSAVRVYPYSVYLGSYRTPESLQKAVSTYRKKGLSPYWVKVDLGEKGIWFRVFTGFFKTRGVADAFIRENHLTGVATKHTKYAVLVGTYESDKELNAKKLELRAIGCCPYDVKGIDGACRLYTGAFYQMVRARKHKTDLASKGIQGEVVER